MAGDALSKLVGDGLVAVLHAHAGEIALAVAEAGRSGLSRRRDGLRAHQGIGGVVVREMRESHDADRFRRRSKETLTYLATK